MKRVGAVLRWTSRLLLALVAILAIFVSEENIRGRIMLARHKAELRAKGEKLTLAELDLPKPPREGNAAGALLEAAEELQALSGLSPLEAFGLEGMKFVQPARAVVLHEKQSLVDRRPVGGRQTTTACRIGDVASGFRTCLWDEVSSEILQGRPTLEKARHALRQPVLGVQLNYEEGIDLRLPHLRKTRTLARWMAAAALDDLRRCNLDGSVDNVSAAAALMRFSKHERLYFSQIVRIRIGEIGLQATWELLQSAGWTDAKLERLQRAWELNELLSDVAKSFEGERAIMLTTFARFRGKQFSRELRYQVEESRLRGANQWQTVQMVAQWLLWRYAWYAQDELWSLRQWQRALEAARLAAESNSWQAVRSQLQRSAGERWTRYDRWRFLFSALIGPSGVIGEILKPLRFETQRQMALAAIALKRYELRYGGLPAELAALVPEFLAELPRDYMDGQPLRYRLNSDGSFVLYSVGEDGVDDGGDPNPVAPRKFRNIWDGCDAVWPQPAAQQEVEAAVAQKRDPPSQP